jgi:type I restriction enzyme R subunit
LTLKLVREVLDTLKTEKPQLAPAWVWQAYARLDNVQPANPISELTTLVALICRVVGIDEALTPYASTVDRNLQMNEALVA